MSALDEIKSGSEKVSMSNIASNRHKKNISSNVGVRHDRGTVSSPDPSTTSKRNIIDVSSISQSATEEEKQKYADALQVKESIEKDVLDLDNPDSAFSKYLDEKVEDAMNYMAEKKEEDELDEDESDDGVLSISLDEPDEEDNVSISLDDPSNYDVVDLDISKLNTKEDNNMSEELIIDTSDEDLNEDEIIDENEDDFGVSLDEIEEINEEEEELEGSHKDPIGELGDYGPVEEDADEVEEEKEEVLGNPLNDMITEEDIKKASEAENKLANKIDKKPERVSAPDMNVEVQDTTTSVSPIIDDEDDEGVVETENDDETLKKLQRMATEKLKPVSKSLDISSFTILKKPVTNVNNVLDDNKARVAKWVLPAQESTVLMKTFSGSFMVSHIYILSFQ